MGDIIISHKVDVFHPALKEWTIGEVCEKYSDETVKVHLAACNSDCHLNVPQSSLATLHEHTLSCEFLHHSVLLSLSDSILVSNLQWFMHSKQIIVPTLQGMKKYYLSEIENHDNRQQNEQLTERPMHIACNDRKALIYFISHDKFETHNLKNGSQTEQCACFDKEMMNIIFVCVLNDVIHVICYHGDTLELIHVFFDQLAHRFQTG